MTKIRGMRWWMVGLVTAGLIVNYLARNTLSVAAPTMMSELNITTQEYSYIVVAWQVCYALMQPIAGYVIDAIGTKLGFAVFALAWSVACACAATPPRARRRKSSMEARMARCCCLNLSIFMACFSC